MDPTAEELRARLKQNPNDDHAFSALRAHYHRMGDYASLANLLEGWAGYSRDPGAAAHALYEAGELVLGALGDRERSVRLYERALTMDAGHAEAFARLRGLFEEQGERRRLADLLERRAEGLTASGHDPGGAALAFHELGELWQHQFQRSDRAVQFFRRAFELDPSLVPAIYAAREIYRQAGNLKAAATLLELEAKAEPDRGRKVALFRELAHLRARDLSDFEGAILALKRALGSSANDPEVLLELAQLHLGRAESIDDPLIAEADRHRAADLLTQLAAQLSSEHSGVYLEQALDAAPGFEPALIAFEAWCEEIQAEERLPARWVAFLARQPTGPEAAIRRLRLADAYLVTGQVDYAVTCLEWLLEEGDARAAERLVELYRHQGREPEALEAMAIAVAGLPSAERLPRLRDLVSAHRSRGDLDRATEHAVALLELDPNDAEAIGVVREACRASGDYAPLREALLGASRAATLSVEGRADRLKEVAKLSEERLEDLDGAISAWRGVSAIDPSDGQARAALKRLLTDAERWDELIEVLDREAVSLTDPRAKARLYHEMATIHRGLREDLSAAIRCLRHLRELTPDDREGRDAYCDVLLEAGLPSEALPLLQARIAEATGAERAELCRLAASVYEEQLEDSESAFRCWAQLLDESPTDTQALDRMEAIDAEGSKPERLLGTLSYRVEVTPMEGRAAILVRMGGIADTELDDLERAAEYYLKALELSPREPGLLETLTDVYDRAERHRDLVVLLKSRAQTEEDAGTRAELYRHIARTLAERVGNDEGAAEAYREVLRAGEDEEALRYLRRHTLREGDHEGLADTLRRMADVVADDDEVRELWIERADVIADALDRPSDAIADVRRVLESAPEHFGALSRLADFASRVGDLEALADALWRQLALLEEPEDRIPIAKRLADIHERERPDAPRAIDALEAWADADVGDPEPLERAIPLLEAASRYEPLTQALDALSDLELDEERSRALRRRAAALAYRQLGDLDGAWERLAPLTLAGDGAAEEQLRELARAGDRGEALAELYVDEAKGAESADGRKRRWRDAAGVYETFLSDPTRALEATLRALAEDFSDEALLDEADRLAAATSAHERLGQVYEALVRRAEDPKDKVRLLLRHADRLESHDLSAALDQTLRACSVDPDDDEVLAIAEARAPRAGRAEELLVAYDRRRQRAETDDDRVDALLRATSLAEATLTDRSRALSSLAQAVALTVRSPGLTENVEAMVQTLDEHPGAEGTLRRALVDLYAKLAEDMEEDPSGGAKLLMRAARVLSEDLRDTEGAFDALKRAASYAAFEAEVVDALDAFARSLGRLDDLDRALEALIAEALDSKTAADLLWRRGRLLENDLGRPEGAAEVFTRLASVSPDDEDARVALRRALSAAGRHQDLLVALQRELKRADDPARRLALAREVAVVWERDLGNRWEALDAWKKVLAEAPEDEEARAAVARLSKGPVVGTDSNVSLELDGAAEIDDYTDITDSSEHRPPALVPADGADELPPVRQAVPTRELRPPRDDEEPAPSEPPPLPSQPPPSRAERQTAQLDPREIERARASEQPPVFADPPPPDAFDDEDYTAVGDNIFDVLEPTEPPVLGSGSVEQLETGEIQLLEEIPEGVPIEDGFDSLSDVQSLDDAELEVVDEIDDEIEEIDELDVVPEGPSSTVPPPPRRR